MSKKTCVKDLILRERVQIPRGFQRGKRLMEDENRTWQRFRQASCRSNDKQRSPVTSLATHARKIGEAVLHIEYM